jgi:hypothetical protein
MSTTIQEGKFLSDLLGAHDISDFVAEVVTVSQGTDLERGDVLAMTAAKQVTLVGMQGTTPDQCYGILLDYAWNAGSLPVDTVTVARSGVFDATQLRVGGTVTLAQCESQLRLIGIFLEKLALVP